MSLQEHDTTIDVRIFDLQPLKRIFFSTAALSLLISVTGVVLVWTLPPLLPDDHFIRRYAIEIFIGSSILRGILSARKKMLEAVRTTEPFDARCKAYERLYRRQMILIVISALFHAVLLVLSRRYFMLFVAGFHILTLIASYPYPTVIRKQLKDDDMVFQ